MKRKIWDSHARTFVDHGTTPRPINAAIQYCTENMTVAAFALGRHWDSFGTVDVFVVPPTSQGFAHTALGALEPLPVEMKTITKYTEGFAEGQIPNLVPASHQ